MQAALMAEVSGPARVSPLDVALMLNNPVWQLNALAVLADKVGTACNVKIGIYVTTVGLDFVADSQQ